MKILLIQPPSLINNTIGPPLGLSYLAICLENAGHKVRIVDSYVLRYKMQDIKREIICFDPDTVGITSTTQNIYNALSIAKFVKENNPNCLTILGGPHPTVLSKETLDECHCVDVIVRGEGEITIVDLLEKFEKNRGFSDVKGITYRDNGKIVEKSNRLLIEDLDSLPLPAYHLLPMDKYLIKSQDNNTFGRIGQRYCGINTSRGCPYNCIFCSSRRLWGKRWRARSPENVIEEIRILRDKYKMEVIDFMDDTFSIDKKRIEKLNQLIKDEGIDVSFICTTRVNEFNKKLSNTLKNMGCTIVFFGFESGVQKTLDYLCKGFTIEDSKNAVKYAEESNLKVGGSFIIGVPIETKEMILQTIKFAKKLNLKNADFNIFTPLPGTKIYEIAEKNNLLLTHDWTKYTFSNVVLKNDNFNPHELKKIYIQSNFYYGMKRFLNFLSK